MNKGISGSWLKLIACMSMLIDHTAAHVFKGMDWVHSCLFLIGNHEITPYFVMRNVIGRWAFPLFAFLIVEGFLHTHDRKRYGMKRRSSGGHIAEAVLGADPVEILQHG